MVQDQVDPRAGRDHGEALQQLQRIEQQMRGPVRPSVPEPQQRLFGGRHLQSLLGNRRAQRVSAQPLEPMAMARRCDHAGMQVEAVAAGVAVSS